MDLDLEADLDWEVDEDHSWLRLCCSEEDEEEELEDSDEDSSLLFSRQCFSNDADVNGLHWASVTW